MANLAQALADEVERVTAKRERWRGYAQTGGSPQSYAPGIILMTAGIDEAKAALGQDDAIASLRAYETLKGFDSDD